MQESLTESETKKSSIELKCEEPAVPYEMLKDDPLYVKCPEALEKLISHPGQTFTCPKRGILMVRDPKWTLTTRNQVQTERKEERSVTADRAIKAAPKQKALKPGSASSSAASGKVRPLPKAFAAKTTRELTKYGHAIKETQLTLAIATGDEAKDYVTKPAVDSAREAMDTLLASTDSVKSLLQENDSSKKDDLSKLLEKCEMQSDNLTLQTTRLDGPWDF